MEKKYILAYDLGTSGVKSALVTLEGEIVSTKTVSYPLYTPQENWAEQDPEDYWRGVCNVTRQVMEGTDPASIAGIAFGTMWKGIIPVDREGKVLHNSIIWLDARAGDQARRLNERFPQHTVHDSDYWPKLMWLRENRPEIIEQAEIILETNSYLKWKLTGEAAVDASNSYVRSFDPEMDDFYREFLEFIDIPREKFPKIVRSEELVGYVTEAAAAEAGLIPGIPVFGGNNDIQAMAVGSGCAATGGVHVYFGSSGWVGYTMDHTPRTLYTSPFNAERDVNTKGMQAIGLSFNWVSNKLYKAEFEQLGDGVIGLINRDVAEIPAGSEGVLATPWFYGGRPPVVGRDARGNFLNLGPNHDRRHMARAMMEGVCFHLKARARGACEQDGYLWPEAINAIGGGACSDEWMQMLADILEIPVRVPRSPRHVGAVGTAYSALVGLGICPDYTEAANRVQIEKTFLPREENREVYRRHYEVFTQLYTMLKPMFSRLNGDE